MANSKKSAKRKPTPASWKPGQSGNPYGRPKDDESWSGVLRILKNMTAEEVAEMVGGRTTDLGRQFLLMPKNVQMKYLMSLRAMAGFMFEPNGALWEKIMERDEGRVTQGVDVTSKGESLIPKMSDAERIARMKELAAAFAEEVKKNES